MRLLYTSALCWAHLTLIDYVLIKSNLYQYYLLTNLFNYINIPILMRAFNDNCRNVGIDYKFCFTDISDCKV